MGPGSGTRHPHLIDSSEGTAHATGTPSPEGIGALVSTSTSIALSILMAVRSATSIVRPAPRAASARYNATSASISIALGILRAVNSASKIFIPLKGVTSIALSIFETADKVHSDKEDWCELSDHISVYLAVIMKHMEEDTQRVPDDWTASLNALQSTLEHIEAEIKALQQDNFLKRVWHRFSNPKLVGNLQKEFDQAIELCQFRAALMTAAGRLKCLSEGNQTKMIEGLLRRFKDDIAPPSSVESARVYGTAVGTGFNGLQRMAAGSLGQQIPDLLDRPSNG